MSMWAPEQSISSLVAPRRSEFRYAFEGEVDPLTGEQRDGTTIRHG
jgi:hypothetical protein